MTAPPLLLLLLLLKKLLPPLLLFKLFLLLLLLQELLLLLLLLLLLYQVWPSAATLVQHCLTTTTSPVRYVSTEYEMAENTLGGEKVTNEKTLAGEVEVA